MPYMERWVLRDIHTGAQFNTHLSLETQECQTGSHADTKGSHTHTHTGKYLFRHTPKQSQVHLGHFFQRKTQSHGHTNRYRHRQLQGCAGTQAQSKHNHALQMYKDSGTLSYTWAITPRATYIHDREVNEHREANTLKDNQRPRHNRHTGTHPGTGRTSSGTPSPLGARKHLGTRPQVA